MPRMNFCQRRDAGGDAPQHPQRIAAIGERQRRRDALFDGLGGDLGQPFQFKNFRD